MSGYSKNQQYVYDTEATRSNQIPSYTGITQPEFASQYADAPARLTHGPSNEMPYIPSSTYESRGIPDHNPNLSFIDAQARHPASHTVTETEIIEPIAPSQGTSGSTVALQLRTNYDLASNQYTFILMFGSKKCVAALQKVECDDDWYNYVLNVEVPPFPLTNSFDPTMMLKLQMENKMGHLRYQSDVGRFTYTDMSPNLAYQSSPEFSRKRKHSTEFGDAPDYSDGNSAKRATTLRLQSKPRSISGPYSAAQLSPLATQSPLSDVYGRSSGYDQSNQPSYTPQMSQKGLYAVPSGMGMGRADYKLHQMSAQLPLMASSVHSYSHFDSLAQGSRNSAPNTSSVLPSLAALAAPTLVRATHHPQAGASASSSQAFNPYSMYQSKALLKIDGELEKMSKDWSQEELDAKRRLVEFKRSQQGSTITTTFTPVTPEARSTRSICVSCIWWEEKNDCFITSVDTIYLLEQLVNVRFTVEEKNRIRRNLEGFRPLTVSKAKADSEDFFKIIMGFPNPKPRNIEKDVKVFPWKILSHALKKIISKYSASYSSTAGVGSLPISSTSTSAYAPGAVSQATMDAHRNTSPHSVATSITSTVYTPTVTSSSLSPHLRMAAGLEGSAGHGTSVTQRTPSGQAMTHWTTHQMPQYPATFSQGGQDSWNYGYITASAASGVSSTAHSLQMPRPHATANLSQIPAEHAYQQYGEGAERV